MKTVLNFALAGCMLLVFGLTIQNSQAVMLFGSGDPAYNTTPPGGTLQDSGWQYEGQWGGFLGTPIAPQYFIAAQHIGGGIGQTFTYQGVNYITTAVWCDPNSDLCIWKVDDIFPDYAPLYSGNDEVGKDLVVFGRGTQRGEPIYVTEIQTVYTTNTATLKSLGVTKKTATLKYPGATVQGQNLIWVTSETITNEVLKGWYPGPSDGVMRWGCNTVDAANGNILGATFKNNAGMDTGFLSGGDSSGGVFIQENGVWKLGGINYAIEGPFSLTPDSPTFYGAIFDENGLYINGCLIPEDNVIRSAYFYCTRISARMVWIQSIIAQ